MKNSHSLEKTRKFLKNSDLSINYNKFNSRAASVLNRVSSRGDSEESDPSYYAPKLNARPRRRGRIKRSKPLIKPNSRPHFEMLNSITNNIHILSNKDDASISGS